MKRQRLFIEPVDKAGLADFVQYRVVDETFRVCRFGLGVRGEIEHGLHRRGRHEGQFFPCGEESLIGIFQVGRVCGLGILADDLLGEFRVSPGDVDALEICLLEAPLIVRVRFDVVLRAG